jgi:hypothetical protein
MMGVNKPCNYMVDLEKEMSYVMNPSSADHRNLDRIASIT